MATIDISRNHQLELDEAKQRAEQLAKDLQAKLGIDWRWDGDRIRFHADSGAAKGAKGQVSVDTSSVRVEIDLPLLLRAMKGTISGKVNAKLDKLVG
jgi:putative polyhydroxyalkanoate system protein